LTLPTPYKEIAERLGRTRNAVHLKARKLGLRKMEFGGKNEDQLLCEQRPALQYGQVAEILGRSSGAVNTRVTTLALKPKFHAWAEEEIRYLETNYVKLTAEVMAAELRRTQRAVLQKAQRERIVCKRRWSKVKICELRNPRPRYTAREIAEKIGRSHGAVRSKTV